MTKADNMRKVHEHIIQIPPFVTRALLWRGLEQVARHPEQFVEHMEGCEILSENLLEEVMHLAREVNFGGDFHLRDKVILKKGESVKTVVEAGKTWPASSFLMKIEEPEQGSLFVRFIYEADEPLEALNPMVEQLRRQAYETKDRDLIERIIKSILQGDLS